MPRQPRQCEGAQQGILKRAATWLHLQSLGHVLEAVQHLVRRREGRGQGDFGDDAMQPVHVADQQARALVVAGWARANTQARKRGKLVGSDCFSFQPSRCLFSLLRPNVLWQCFICESVSTSTG